MTNAGRLAINTFAGAGTYVATIQRSDPRWSWTDNAGLPNTGHATAHGRTGTDALPLSSQLNGTLSPGLPPVVTGIGLPASQASVQTAINDLTNRINAIIAALTT